MGIWDDVKTPTIKRHASVIPKEVQKHLKNGKQHSERNVYVMDRYNVGHQIVINSLKNKGDEEVLKVLTENSEERTDGDG